MARVKIEVFETKVQGGHELSTIECGRRIHRRYFGYTKRERQRLFKQYVKEQMQQQ